MKKYVVTAIVPATAEVTVTGENRADAVDKVKGMIDIGGGLDFTVDIVNSDDVDFSVKELRKKPVANSAKPELKRYIVVLEATSVKEVPIKAVSPEAAEALAKEMYFTSDVIDFTDADVIRVRPSVELDEEDTEAADMADDLMTGLVKLIRSTDAPDEVLGHILNRSVQEAFSIENDED